jgi:hypothetical protein
MERSLEVMKEVAFQFDGDLTAKVFGVEIEGQSIVEDYKWMIQTIERLEETVRIYKVSDDIVKEQSKKVKHLFPLENTVGYGQLCDKVLELSEEKSFFVKAYTEKIMKED